MAEPTPSETIAELSTAAAMFPDAKSIFGISLKPIHAVKESCIVVLDTNVLLVPYTINPKGLSEIKKAYKALLKTNRLKIPAQVAREFAKNRPNKLSELYQQLSSKRSKVPGFQKGQYPLLESLPEYAAVVDLERTLDKQLESYKSALSKLIDHIRNWTWNDPVSLLYGQLFTPETIVEAEITNEALEADIKRRIQLKIPPGYKDASKPDSGAGDILIWHTIMSLGEKTKKDVLFVSADGKPDWFHQSDGPLYPRFELVDEFRRRSQGASFHILKLSDFLDLFDAKGEVVEEVRQEEEKLIPLSQSGITIKRGLLAEEAVGRWLVTRWPAAQIGRSDDEALDYAVTMPDGGKLGVIVKVVIRPWMWKAQILKLIDRHVSRGSSTFSRILVCVVAESRDAAAPLAKYIARREGETAVGEACIGWLDADNSFVEEATIPL